MGHVLDVEGSSYESTFEDVDEGTEFDEKYVEEIEQYTLLGNGGRKLGKVDKRVEQLEKKLEDMSHLVNQLVGAVEELGTKRIILSEVEDELPGDIEGLPESLEIVIDKGGKEISKEFKKQANKILEK